MNYYTFYDLNGEWQQTGYVTTDLEYLPVPDGFVCVAGEYSHETRLVDGEVVHFSDTEIAALRNERQIKSLRSIRDALLQQSDWTQVADAPVDQAAWAEYRQALRDLPENTTDPANPVWPSKPQ